MKGICLTVIEDTLSMKQNISNCKIHFVRFVLCRYLQSTQLFMLKIFCSVYKCDVYIFSLKVRICMELI